MVSLLVLFCFYHVLFLISLFRRNNSHVDVGWGASFFLLVGVLFWECGVNNLAQIGISCLVGMWGARLSVHLFIRQCGQPEDFRYKSMRTNWGTAWVWKSYIWVYLLQFILMLVISLPIYCVFLGAFLYMTPVIIGAIVAALGLLIEVISDEQLRQYKKREGVPRFIQHGLWKYSRHPNYFGEAVFWWGIGCISLSVSWGLLGLLGSLVFTILLRYVSGVPLLERRYRDDKEFQASARHVPVFFPTGIFKRS